VLVSVTVRAFADRGLLLLDASDGEEVVTEFPLRGSPTPGLARREDRAAGCSLTRNAASRSS
jgi:hypothetical protein